MLAPSRSSNAGSSAKVTSCSEDAAVASVEPSEYAVVTVPSTVSSLVVVNQEEETCGEKRARRGEEQPEKCATVLIKERQEMHGEKKKKDKEGVISTSAEQRPMPEVLSGFPQVAVAVLSLPTSSMFSVTPRPAVRTCPAESAPERGAQPQQSKSKSQATAH